ncbi:hypothetical protein [Thiocapsa bogorovii]|uniref:hypothetical protein n=1 Tax=Thiocapsa bogorovii TaxID=521689 RepID=UPI001E49D77D|nr:hypothetical protein [Thiocapsa bogorovii]UHD15908.1 hypothetical protein LT988_22060 [Thiocapsa bogorovii]
MPYDEAETRFYLIDPKLHAKGYDDCRRFSIHYVFATNGHRYGEFDRISGLTTGPHDFDLFPTHAELVERYARDTGIDLTEPAANLLFTSDSPAYAENPRYYQSAAIRAVIAKILHCERDGLPARALLVLDTGSVISTRPSSSIKWSAAAPASTRTPPNTSSGSMTAPA